MKTFFLLTTITLSLLIIFLILIQGRGAGLGSFGVAVVSFTKHDGELKS